MIEFTAKEQARYDETLALLEQCNFTVVTKREGERMITIQAVTKVEDSSVNLSYGISRPNVRLRIVGFGLTGTGRTVYLKNEEAVRTFVKSQQHGS